MTASGAGAAPDAGQGVTWPSSASPQLCAEVHRLMVAVVEAGGAIGWPEPPDRTMTDRWLATLLAQVRAGEAALAVIGSEARVQAIGAWQRAGSPVHRQVAELQKVMVDPAHRGRGLGRLVTRALLDDLTRAGTVEIALLATRGNNSAAISLYRQLGFVEWGRVPGGIAVGGERYDDVRMMRRLDVDPMPS
jgi:ribosomal protein S18 acetylase RimI-like enzyme